MSEHTVAVRARSMMYPDCIDAVLEVYCICGLVLLEEDGYPHVSLYEMRQVEHKHLKEHEA